MCQTRLANSSSGPVERLGLHVLRQRDRHRTGLGLVGEHPHATEQGVRQGLRAPHPLEEPRQRPEGVARLDVVAGRVLELLEHRAADPGGEDVAGQQQHRLTVRGRHGGAGQHVRRARTDGRGAGQGLQPVQRAGVPGGRVHHALLVAGQVVRQVRLTRGGGLQQRLPDPRHVAVAEDPEGPRDQPPFHAVALAVLVRQEPHHRLRDGQSHRCHLPDLLGSSCARAVRPDRHASGRVPARRAACRRPGRITGVCAGEGRE